MEFHPSVMVTRASLHKEADPAVIKVLLGVLVDNMCCTERDVVALEEILSALGDPTPT